MPSAMPSAMQSLAFRLRLIATRFRWRARDAGPQTALGRWCGVWYNDACDAMSKGALADADNSVWQRSPLQGKQNGAGREEIGAREARSR
jgi:hypothetical protein